MKKILLYSLIIITSVQCKKSVDGGTNNNPTPPIVITPAGLTINSSTVDNLIVSSANTNYNISLNPSIKISFNKKVDRNTVAAVKLNQGATNISLDYSWANGDSVLLTSPVSSLSYLTSYNLNVATTIASTDGGHPLSSLNIKLVTKIDSSDKFPLLSDNQLLDKVQQQTFKYFWDFAHPVSGLARERNTSGDVVTSGGSGFGIMSIPVAISRSFITRAEGLARMQTIVSFLKNTAQKFHGAFPHWLNGSTGAVVPFSANDNGADLVETSYLMQGLICARQYFDGTSTAETALRSDINILWDGVEWDWFRQSNQNVLYWHWSPNFNWVMNLPIHGWNECLITYVLGASSTTHSIPKIVYDDGWAQNGAMQNNNTYYGLPLPLGQALGGPLFFSQYSFLGIDPNQLTDVYANYWTQNRNHSLINYNYCVANPQHNFGYSNLCWGLTASDIQNGYTASSPTNDVGVIAPTAALSAFPYSPTESMNALKFYYYKLGDKLWGEYGFVDAFSLRDLWFANSTLAIDQGPIIVMIENYRTGLLWNLFTSAPEVKSGMLALGFTAPYL